MSDETYLGYPAEDIEEGVKIVEGPWSGNTYRVTKWIDKGDGSFAALEKELISIGMPHDGRKPHCDCADPDLWVDERDVQGDKSDGERFAVCRHCGNFRPEEDADT